MSRLPLQQFFELVDEVLVGSANRAPLDPTGPQRAIIEVRPDDAVLQILAGPGSGKTEMLVWRILFELFVRGADSSRLMVTTFTNKAATDLSVRVVERSDALLRLARNRGLDVADPHVHDLRIGTLHSLCDSLLAEFDEAYMAAGTEVVDEIETRVRLARSHRWAFRSTTYPDLLDSVFDAQELVALFRPPWLGATWPARTIDRVTFLLSLLGQQTETWIPRCAATGRLLNGVELVHGPEGLTERLATLQRKWEGYLDGQQVLDFATIQKRFFDRQASVLPELDHVFVDEFQDTNPIQFAIHTGWLQAGQMRLTVVGDDDQSIYRFRGSDIECFMGLRAACTSAGLGFRMERLEENWRSTARIAAFTKAFKDNTVLAALSMDKQVHAPASAPEGNPVRLVEGPWGDLCALVADEVATTGAGRVPAEGDDTPPSAAILMFSTSEKPSQGQPSPATELRTVLEDAGLRVDNPRNKMAAAKGSPVYELLALISYLIDPVTRAPIGKRGRPIEVWASCRTPGYAQHAISAPPPFLLADDHATIQKGFRKDDGSIDVPGPSSGPLLTYVDEIRDRLISATAEYDRGKGREPRLTLSGLVARLLSFERYRAVGFTTKLFREALFTALLESNIAPSRRSMHSLDEPLTPRIENGKVAWPQQFWNLLGTFGAIVNTIPMDDPEVEAFSDNAVAMLTFHQSKGLEFDHVYVALTGREASPHAVLQTLVFSGSAPSYTVENGVAVTKEQRVLDLSEADRCREIYVALTRAKKSLTVLYAPNDDRNFMALHEGLAAVFATESGVPHLTRPTLTVREFPA